MAQQCNSQLWLASHVADVSGELSLKLIIGRPAELLDNFCVLTLQLRQSPQAMDACQLGCLLIQSDALEHFGCHSFRQLILSSCSQTPVFMTEQLRQFLHAPFSKTLSEHRFDLATFLIRITQHP